MLHLNVLRRHTNIYTYRKKRKVIAHIYLILCKYEFVGDMLAYVRALVDSSPFKGEQQPRLMTGSEQNRYIETIVD